MCSVVAFPAYAAVDTTNSSYQQEVQEIIQSDAEGEEYYVDIDDANDGLDTETNARIDAFIAEYDAQLEYEDGYIVTEEIDQEYFIEKYGEDIVVAAEDNIEEINESVEDGDLEVTDNGTIIEEDDEDMYIQGKVNVTKGTTYWWGRIIYLSYSRAKNMRASLKGDQSRTEILTWVAGFAGLRSTPAGVAGLAAAGLNKYVSTLRANIKKYNKKGKGIKYKIYWYGNYHMRTQGQSW